MRSAAGQGRVCCVRMRWLSVVLLIAVSWLSSRAVAAQPAAAAPKASEPHRAKAADTDKLMAVAEQARRLGRYGFAAQAFKQAYKAKPSASLLLSIAEAYQQRFKAKRGAYDRVQALVYFQKALDSLPVLFPSIF